MKGREEKVEWGGETRAERHMPQNATDHSFPHCSSKGFRTVLEIDTLGTFNMCNAAFPRLKEANGATIVSVTATLHYGNTDKTEMRKNTGSFSCLIFGGGICDHFLFFLSFFFLLFRGHLVPGPCVCCQGCH